MSTEQTTALIKQLDQRFNELGIFCNHMPHANLRALLRGEMMLVVTRGDNCTMSWVSATEKPLEKLFGVDTIQI